MGRSAQEFSAAHFRALLIRNVQVEALDPILESRRGEEAPQTAAGGAVNFGDFMRQFGLERGR